MGRSVAANAFADCADDLHTAGLDDLTTGIVIGDAGGRIRYLNPAAEAALGVSRNQVIDVDPSALAPPVRDAAAVLLADTLHHEGPRVHRDLELPKGAYDCSVSGRADGRILAELTAVDWARSAREADVQRTRQSAVATLLRALAHEVNNPLGGVRGAAQLLEHRLQDPSLSEYTQLIIGEVDRLAALVKRVTERGAESQPEPLNVHEVCERVRALVANDAAMLLRIERDYDPSIPPFAGDRGRLIQAVLNLVRNAADAGAATVTLRTRVARQQLVAGKVHALAIILQVSDDGAGVAEDLLHSMFYPLVSGRSEGSGIGLAQAQNAAEAHAGQIECTNLSQPTTFTLTLPILQ